MDSAQGEPGPDWKKRWRVHVPWVNSQFETVFPEQTTEVRDPFPVAGEFAWRFTNTAPAGDIQPAEQRVVYFGYYLPKAGEKYSFVPPETVESLARKARDGRVIIAVTVEWR